ncbi:MAG: hypothetical protein ACD_17C00360G0003 [uncultured bacterium]|nr:MAG: hypothetical protein ACD_17C00360G0003 [uncultured bacterium]OGN56045.1 MAG: hypothetical protein A2796_05585 [Chlamydiae bacterium RIFCSPHIGHO2_01_FULL_44_39]OGN56760.1 MAG: hypothetical protein A3C42_04775 [Chlamydiae bacterium RIFCSPHIGHO2_02_FULL_45_9]OGN60891.1 MAG: hypothetical protein A3D96_01750 [Chlamydiae bacterium RIFCSPHIGHO2_12_FULL_44_59]OGN66477.1 MAG: hypothetical protein A2978_01370 [Chlamydiae bacterium RIFCSPLOWO2_01_FULL_44_52]OGN69940.1 MAG: hypothetical protein A3
MISVSHSVADFQKIQKAVEALECDVKKYAESYPVYLIQRVHALFIKVKNMPVSQDNSRIIQRIKNLHSYLLCLTIAASYHRALY